jgi:hypothetical protein
MPGPAILEAVRMVNNETNASIGALIVAEMSSKGKTAFQKHNFHYSILG